MGPHARGLVSLLRIRASISPHTYAKAPMHARPTMQITDSAFCKKRAAARGLGVMLVEQGRGC